MKIQVQVLNKEILVKLDKNDESFTMDDDDEFNPTLAAMETEIKPKVLKTVNTLTKEYAKLIKYQKEKLRLYFKFSKFFNSKRKRI